MDEARRLAILAGHDSLASLGQRLDLRIFSGAAALAGRRSVQDIGFGPANRILRLVLLVMLDRRLRHVQIGAGRCGCRQPHPHAMRRHTGFGAAIHAIRHVMTPCFVISAGA